MNWLLILLGFALVVVVFIYASFQEDKVKFKKTVLWLLAISLILFFATGLYHYFQNRGFENEKLGKYYNTIRKQAGIDTIPAGWVLRNPPVRTWTDRFKARNSDYTLRYINPDSLTNPVHLEKIIWVMDDRVKWEMDYFRNGKESLETLYDYGRKTYTKSYFPHHDSGREYTDSAVDSILAAWRQNFK